MPLIPTLANLDQADDHEENLSPIALRLPRLSRLFDLLTPVPDEWAVEAFESKKAKLSGISVAPIRCESYKTLINSWRKAMRWTDGLDCALSVMLASITSTKMVGSQLWVKIISPASAGKSTLCEAISVAKKYVYAKSTMRGFHSGTSDDTGEDYSMINKIRDKTLVTKDGDTLLQSPNLGQILSEARDLYDTVSRSSYRTRQGGRDYSGVRMTWILCGTSSLRSLDSSELGERFLDCVIMDTIDDELEDEILWRVVNRADRTMAIEANGQAESHQEPEMTRAMQLTGGYVEYLRENAADLMSRTTINEEYKRLCTRLGKFVAFMRARPSKKQEETAEREFAARLVEQHLRLAKCLAVVLNRPSVDEEVMARTRKVSLDTARGLTLDIAKRLYKSPSGLESHSVAIMINQTDDATRPLLRFMGKIGVAELFDPSHAQGVKLKPRWRLTEKMQNLYREVMED